MSKGCHQLIKQGAKLVDDLHDIIDELGLNNLMIHHSFAADHSTNGADKGLFNANLSLLSLMGFEPISLDAIVPVSYTHLDVYKRQDFNLITSRSLYINNISRPAV